MHPHLRGTLQLGARADGISLTRYGRHSCNLAEGHSMQSSLIRLGPFA